MADFTDDAATALFRIAEPVIGGNEAGVDAVMQRQWLMNPAKKALEPKRERSEPAIETDHQQRLGSASSDLRFLVISSHDVAQLIFSEAQRLFTENVLTGVQGCQHLCGMQMMTGCDHDGVDCHITDQAIIIDGT